jgi:putative membrane protein
MAKPFLTPESKTALLEAVRAVESRSSAELVIVVRPQTGSYLHADLLFGILAGIAALAFLLFSPWVFPPVWILIDPLLIGGLAGLAATWTTGLRRLLTPPAMRRRRVETAARSIFVERRVYGTRGRTGILLYVSALEREAAVVADIGCEALTSTDGWRAAVGGIEQAVRNREDGVAVAARIHGLAPLLSSALTRGGDDVNELPDEVC